MARHLHRRARRDPAGHVLPRLAGRIHGRRAAVHRDQAGIRFLPPQLRRAVRVRQVRPAVRAGVQRRRDGERRRGDVPGGLRLPQQGDPRVLRAARRDRAARDGAHVVRRPGHHAWWDDLWLNESFATFASVLCQAEATEYTEAWTTFANVGEVVGLPAGPAAVDAPGRRRHPGPGTRSRSTSTASPTPRAPACSSSWSPTSAWRSSWPGCATTSTPTRSATPRSTICSPRWRRRPAATCRDWGQQWLKTTGLNTLRADFDVDAEAGSPASRSGRAARSRARARPGCTGWRSASTTTTARASWCGSHREELDVEGALTEVPALQGVSRGKLILVNDDDLTYCSLRLDPESLETALTRIADIAEPLPRTLAWSAAWEMTRDAELKARDFVALVISGVHAETEVGVAQRLLLQAQTALSSYADPGWASETAGRLRRPAAGTGPRRRARAPITSWPTSTRCARRCFRPRHIEVLPTLLDTDPRAWPARARRRHRPALAHRHALAAAGVIDSDGPGHPFIDAEAQRDPTAAGSGTAAAARRRGRRRRSRSGLEQVDRGRHAAQHHRARDHRRVRPTRAGGAAAAFTAELLRRHPGVWDRRSSEVAQTVVIGLYPSWDISDAAVEAADEFLAGDHAARAAPAGGRRPGRSRARPAGKGFRRHLTLPRSFTVFVGHTPLMCPFCVQLTLHAVEVAVNRIAGRGLPAGAAPNGFDLPLPHRRAMCVTETRL